VGDAFRVELIVALRDVRQQLGSARCAQQRLEAAKETVRSSASLLCPRVDSADASALCVVRQAEASAASLRAENEKLRYRVTHLVRSLKEADAARPPPPPPQLQRFSTTPFAYKSPLAAAAAPPPATP
jgi:hypothetical protein